jgi:hypothetical protein
MHRFARLGLFGSLAVIALSLAFVRPGAARIVYTPANQTLNGSGMLTIDFNRDGILDASIQQSSRVNGFNCWLDLVQAYPGTSGAVVATDQGGFFWASALSAGSVIGPRSPLEFGEALMLHVTSGTGCTQGTAGFWDDQAVHYLGIAFIARGALHYGWVQLRVSYSNFLHRHVLTTALTGYAYETIAGRRILAGST